MSARRVSSWTRPSMPWPRWPDPGSPSISWRRQPPMRCWTVAGRWTSPSSARRPRRAPGWSSATHGRPVASCRQGDIVINELACGYNGYSVQLGTPICIGEPPSWIREFYESVVLPGYDLMAEQLVGGNTWDEVMKSSAFFRDMGYDSRSLFLHCIDFVSHPPHVMWDHVVAEDDEQILGAGDGGDARADDHHPRWAVRHLLRTNLCPHRGWQREGDQVPPRAAGGVTGQMSSPRSARSRANRRSIMGSISVRTSSSRIAMIAIHPPRHLLETVDELGPGLGRRPSRRRSAR